MDARAERGQMLCPHVIREQKGLKPFWKALMDSEDGDLMNYPPQAPLPSCTAVGIKFQPVGALIQRVSILN